MAATLSHLPPTTIVFPLMSRAGTLTHFPLTLISMMLSAMGRVSCGARNNNATNEPPQGKTDSGAPSPADRLIGNVLLSYWVYAQHRKKLAQMIKEFD